MRKSQLFSDEMVQFVIDQSKTTAQWEMHEVFNEHFGTTYTHEQLQNLMDRKHIKCIKKKRSFVYPEEVINYVREITNGRHRIETWRLTNEKFGTNYELGAFIGMMKRYHLGNGIDMRKKKGCISPTKGKKVADFMTPEQIEVFKSNQFTKGHRPVTQQSIGSINGRCDGYRWIKVKDEDFAKDNWMLEHVYIWQQAYGPVPEGKCIYHLDGNPSNNDLSNLILADRDAVAYMNINGLQFKDAEINKASYLTSKLILEIKRKEKVNETR